MAFKIPQGGHSVIAAVTSASLLLVGAAVSTVVLEMPLTQALAASADAASRTPAAAPQGAADETDETRAKLARCACSRWRRSTSNDAKAPCAVDQLVVSQDWVVARLDLHPGRAVEVMHLIDGHVDEDWHLASTRARH